MRKKGKKEIFIIISIVIMALLLITPFALSSFSLFSTRLGDLKNLSEENFLPGAPLVFAFHIIILLICYAINFVLNVIMSFVAKGICDDVVKKKYFIVFLSFALSSIAMFVLYVYVVAPLILNYGG